MRMQEYEFWFVVGSQFLYGPEVLETVARRAAEMADLLNASGNLPCRMVYKVTAKTNQEIADVVREANYDPRCAGIITWCHTFSPSKMWINGFVNLQKPYCHFATQYNREIPNEEIDMDFMNLNQAAHGDREHGFLAARLRMPRKIIAGYWQDEEVQKRLGRWMRTAVGVAVSRELKVMRFGDNMREVAVTEGDKVEVQAKLGWQVNTWAVGDLVKVMNEVTDAEIDALMEVYRANDCLVISDEIWSDIILNGHKHIPTQSVSEDARSRTVALYAPSKTFNLAGLVGSYHIIYNPYLRDRVRAKSSKPHYNDMNVLSMHALIGAYKPEGYEWVEELRETISGNVNFACDYITQHFEGVSVSKPEGTYMLFLDCTDWCRAHGKTIAEVEKAGWNVGVAWQDGRMFHGPCAIRMNLALPLTRVQEAFERLDKYVFNEEWV